MQSAETAILCTLNLSLKESNTLRPCFILGCNSASNLIFESILYIAVFFVLFLFHFLLLMGLMLYYSTLCSFSFCFCSWVDCNIYKGTLIKLSSGLCSFPVDWIMVLVCPLTKETGWTSSRENLLVKRGREQIIN